MNETNNNNNKNDDKVKQGCRCSRLCRILLLGRNCNKCAKSEKKERTMSEYWLISAPGDKTCQQTWEILNNTTYVQNSLSTNYKFPIPDLKVNELNHTHKRLRSSYFNCFSVVGLLF